MSKKNKGMSKRAVLMLNVVCPLILGAFIYYVLSPDVFFVRKIDDILGSFIRLHLSSGDNVFLKLIRNYFLDMLWGYALVFALFFMIGNSAVNIREIFWIAFLFSIVIETIQITPFISGTFDVFDIGAEFLSELIAAFILYAFGFKEDSKNETKD